MTTPHTILLYPPTLSMITSIHKAQISSKSGSKKVDCFGWHPNLTKSFQLLVPPSEIWSPNHPTHWHHRRLNFHGPPSLPGAAFGSQHLKMGAGSLVHMTYIWRSYLDPFFSGCCWEKLPFDLIGSSRDRWWKSWFPQKYPLNHWWFTRINEKKKI